MKIVQAERLQVAQVQSELPTHCQQTRATDRVWRDQTDARNYGNHDGWLDILVLTGSRNGDPPGGASNRLYKNNRDGTFTDVTGKAGLLRSGYWYGVTVGDYNNDGFEDLFLTGYPNNALYRNNGNGTFTDVTQKAGIAGALDVATRAC